jgi:D-arabinose 1-dehydrogenase-like Zn-dependent alcohol dehydrogenase
MAILNLEYPLILGHEIVGVVAAKGKMVERFSVGLCFGVLLRSGKVRGAAVLLMN